MVVSMDKVSSISKMGLDMLVSLPIMRCMDMESIHGSMVGYMKGVGKSL